MTIVYKQGNLLDCVEEFMVHGCNAQGYFNAGVAKAIRKQYPMAYRAYMTRYADARLTLGDIIPVSTKGKTIFNCITQIHFGRDPNVVYVNYHAIQTCMVGIRYYIPEGADVAMPKIGAGLANGDWFVIEDIISRAARDWYTPVVYQL